MEDRRERAKRHCEAALHKGPQARAAYLDDIADVDPALREEVESLLLAHDENRTLDGPIESENPNMSRIAGFRDVRNPERIGPYRLVRAIGEGGMGIVYEAEQEKPVRRKVALKLIKWGMDTKAVIARFESERQALALMNHPSIASIYDGGATEEGRPYFAMEYVQGIPITEYCDKHRLTVRDRLKVFVDVCEGVQHAHQKGIIHRDIKPSNVLMALQGDKSAPKIIDFGVAKATSQRLTEHTVYTELGQLIGTPEYMSPEQAEMTNLDIDTRTDVYSLGVLLYELLAGRTPFDAKELRRAGLVEIQRKLREEEPPRPSMRVSALGAGSAASASNRQVDPRVLERELEGDLDWITMKALEKDRVRRYETAHDLALDVQRYLNDQPVMARPPSARYRLGKLIRRNKGAFLGAAAVVLALLVGFIGTSWALFRAVRAERKAATDTAIAEAVNAFLNDDLLAAAAPSGNPGQGKDVTMREVLDVAAERIEKASTDGGRFADEPLVEASIRTTLGETYLELGEYGVAEPHVRRALALRRQALGEEHPEYEMNLATLYRSQGRYQEAEPLYERNLEARLRALGAEHPKTLETMSALGNHFQETGRYERAEALHRRALENKRRVLGEKSPSTVLEMNNLGNDLALLGRDEEAAPLMHRTIELKIELYGGDHPSTLNSVSNLAELHVQLGRDVEAAALHRQALDARTRVLGPSHPKTLESKYLLAATLSNLGRFAEAERLAGAAVAQSRESLGERHPRTLEAQDTRARALLGLRRAGDAESILRRQLTILGEKKARGDDVGEGDVLAHDMRVHLGMTLAELGRRTEAEALLLESIPKLPPRTAKTTRALQFLVRFYERWDRAQPNQGYAARAAEWQQRLAESAAEPPNVR